MKNEKQNGFSRRQVLRGSSAIAAAGALSASAQAERKRTPFRRAGGSNRVYMQVFLRGAMDGLSAVVPHADGDYYAARPTLAVPIPGAPGGALDLDTFFGLAPAAAPLLTPWSNGHLALVHASGSTDPTRSHFDAFTKMEFGEPNLPPGTVTNGWLARYLIQRAGGATGLLRGVGEGDILPQVLAGAPKTLPVRDLANFLFPGNPFTAQERVDVLSAMYAVQPPPTGPAALDTFASIDLMSTIDFDGREPGNGALYPGSPFGKQLRDAATLIQAQAGVEVITIDYGGWDHHANQGPLDGLMAAMLNDLTRGLEAFYLDMLGSIDDVTLVVQSEFGRRVAQNSSLGTDHGHGNVMMLLGGGISGGQVHGSWPGLAPGQLDFGDLAITTDYRDVVGEILADLHGASPADLDVIFPDHVFTPVGVTV